MNQKAVPRRLVTGPGRGAGTALGFQPVTQLCEFIIMPFHGKVSHHEKSVHLPAERSDSECRAPSSPMVWVCAVDLDNDGLMPSFSLLFCPSPSLPVVFQKLALLDLHMVADPGVSLPSQLRVFVLLSF